MRINLKLSLFLFLAGILSACQPKSESSTENASNQPVATKTVAVSEWPESGSISGDTISIHGKVLLFFGPERENATENDQDFLNMSDRIMAALESETGIRKMYTSASYIKIFNSATGKPMMVDRNQLGKRNGFLITDGGQPPKMSNESLSETDCMMIIRTYFFLPS